MKLVTLVVFGAALVSVAIAGGWAVAFDTVGGTIDDDAKQAEATKADPVASEIPFLSGRAPEEQLRTLKWMLTVPQKLPALFPDLRGPEQNLAVRDASARQRVTRIIASLEAQGLRVPELPAGFIAAKLDTESKEPPHEMPPVDESVLKAIREGNER